MKKKASSPYIPSKSTNEKADAILRQMRTDQAKVDLSKSNKKLGIVIVPKSLDVSTSAQKAAMSTTQTSNNNRARSRKP
jgi:hypothetical protein